MGKIKFRCSKLGELLTKGKEKQPIDVYNDAVLDLNKKQEQYKVLKTKDGVRGRDLTNKISDLNELLPKFRANKDTIILSQTAKSMIKSMVKEEIFGYKKNISTKEMEKGIIVEPESIELYGSVRFVNAEKNTERRSNDWIEGECDINLPKLIVDAKSPWSLDTFPAAPSDINEPGYEWQGRGYMWLWEKERFELAYCMVNTPFDLLKDWDDSDIHDVSKIDPTLLVTSVYFDRDKSLEEKIKKYVIAGRKYYHEYKQEILSK